MCNVSFRSVAALSVACLGLAASASQAAVLSEGFDNVDALSAAGWKSTNQSTNASESGWIQGFQDFYGIDAAADGPPSSYALAKYYATRGTTANSTISAWLVTPALAFGGVNHTMTFKTRTIPGKDPDRLEVRLSSTTNDTGTTPTDVGAFSTTLLTINPDLKRGPANYPDTWTTYTVNIAGSSVPNNGYVAFRYYVTDGGEKGANSYLVGLDTLNISAVVPEPTSVAAIGLAGAGLLGRRRRA